MNLFNPKGFLTGGGVVLVLVAVLGYVGIIGPTSAQSLFGGAWYFDNGENVAHLVLGVVALVAAFVLNASMQKALTGLVALVAVFFGLYGFLTPNAFGYANLENPLDNVLHLAIAAWAGYSAWKK